jgi:hypothetical protein
VQRNAELAGFVDFSGIDLNFVDLRASWGRNKAPEHQCGSRGNPGSGIFTRSHKHPPLNHREGSGSNFEDAVVGWINSLSWVTRDQGLALFTAR